MLASPSGPKYQAAAKDHSFTLQRPISTMQDTDRLFRRRATFKRGEQGEIVGPREQIVYASARDTLGSPTGVLFKATLQYLESPGVTAFQFDL